MCLSCGHKLSNSRAEGFINLISLRKCDEYTKMLAKGPDKMRTEKNTIFPSYNMLPTRDFKLFFPCVLPGSLFFCMHVYRQIHWFTRQRKRTSLK